MLVREAGGRAGSCVVALSLFCRVLGGSACGMLPAGKSRSRESEEERGAGCSLVWWMPVSNDSNSRWLQFREGAGRSGAECEQVEEGLRTKKVGRRRLKRKGGQQTGRLNRIPFRWPLPITPGGSSDQRAVPQAPRHYQSAKHRPPALVGYRRQKWGRVPWSGQWDAQEACCIGFNAKYSQGEATPRRWPGRSFQHECAPASTSRPHKRQHPPIERFAG